MANKITMKEYEKDEGDETAEKIRVALAVMPTRSTGGPRAPVGAYILLDDSFLMLLDGGKLRTQ